MRIVIDPGLCTGHGRCYDVAAPLVESDDEGRGVVVADVVPTKLENHARAAERNCPERAVMLVGD